MTQLPISKPLNITLWIAQFLLCFSLLFGAGMKLFQSIEQLAAVWPWAGQVSPALVKFTGVIDLLGALGVILPTLFKVKPRMAALAAVGIVLLMICAITFHVFRSEGALVAPDVVFALLAIFVAWGRFKEN